MTKSILIALLLPAVAALPRTRADEFLVQLDLKNAHLAEVSFGCADGASDGYDEGRDDFAPPPGIATGYVGFIPKAEGLPLLYHDVRDGRAAEVEWALECRPFEGKPLVIAWKPDALPAGRDFRVETPDGPADMRTLDRLVLNESRRVLFRATVRQESGSPAPLPAPAVKAAPAAVEAEDAVQAETGPRGLPHWWPVAVGISVAVAATVLYMRQGRK